MAGDLVAGYLGGAAAVRGGGRGVPGAGAEQADPLATVERLVAAQHGADGGGEVGPG